MSTLSLDLSGPHECQLIRHLNRSECVIRLEASGAFLHIRLASPLDVTRACMVCAINPSPGMVTLGPYVKGYFTESTLEIDWPARTYPPPAKIVRRSNLAAQNKRQRTALE
jgi:hypothetical protein